MLTFLILGGCTALDRVYRRHEAAQAPCPQLCNEFFEPGSASVRPREGVCYCWKDARPTGSNVLPARHEQDRYGYITYRRVGP